ncbi:MAG TPA: 30S ribosome-binding factor RbfA [Sutterella sp.]|nr:30S ribosome-binding factor RbfA [Sutterella sp.]
MKESKTGRGIRIADQIARDLAEIIPRELRDPRIGLVTITGCEITPDYAHARVFFTVLGTDPKVCEAGLNAAAGRLRNLIFHKLTIHTVPTLHFVHDTSVEHGFAMDRVIKEAMDVTRSSEEKADKDISDHGK